MPAMTAGQKAGRVLDFLLGLRNPRALAALTRFGFGPSDREEGWTLLKATSDVSFDFDPGPAQLNPKIVKELDDWENQWFNIIDATLSRRYPEVREKVFLNLSQTEGPPVILSVGTLVKRIEALGAESASPREKEARALLATRGLDDVAMVEVKKLLGAAEVPADAPVIELDADARAEAEEAMWAWYLEWSRIARQAITNRKLLRGLGFLERRSGGATEEEAEAPAAPAPSPAPAPVVADVPATD